MKYNMYNGKKRINTLKKKNSNASSSITKLNTVNNESKQTSTTNTVKASSSQWTQVNADYFKKRNEEEAQRRQNPNPAESKKKYAEMQKRITPINRIKALYDAKKININTNEGRLAHQKYSFLYYRRRLEEQKKKQTQKENEFLNRFNLFYTENDIKKYKNAAKEYFNYKTNNKDTEPLREKYGTFAYALVNMLYKNPNLVINYVPYDNGTDREFTIRDTKNGTLIYINENFDTSSDNYDLVSFLEDYNNLSDRNLISSNLEKLYVTSNKPPEYLPNAAAFTDISSGTTYVNRHSYLDGEYILLHEMGHLVDKDHMYSSSKEYKDIVEKDYQVILNDPYEAGFFKDLGMPINKGISNYAQTGIDKGNYAEDFAESYSIFIEAVNDAKNSSGKYPGAKLNYYKNLTPNRYAYFKKNFPEIFEGLE